MNNIIKEILELLPLQRKKITSQLERMSEDEIIELNNFCDSLLIFTTSQHLPENFIANSYKNLNNMMLKQQIYFKKFGKYKSESQEYVNDTLYSLETEMIGHMISLALTQFLWKNHYEMMMYFKKEIKSYVKRDFDILEIGAGHGLFTKELLDLDKSVNIDILDISESSIKLSKKIIENSNSSILNFVQYIHSDITKFKSDMKYDFISMSEVLEHVDKPKQLLASLKNLLNNDGIIYITTCSNCPSLDHVYLFSDINEIKDMIISVGFKIIDELIISAENINTTEALKLKTTLNYSAFLRINDE